MTTSRTGPYTFGWQPDYEIEGKIIGQYVAENMPDAKVGLFLQDDDFGEDAEQGVRQFLDDQIVEVQRYTSGNTDVGAADRRACSRPRPTWCSASTRRRTPP